MGFKCGIVGLPNVGKSTLFNALTQTAAAQAANYPFCTIEPNVGDVAVPDARLDALAAHRQSRRRSSRPGSPSSTSPASCAAPRRAKASATSSSPTSARSTPSPMWCAASRTATSPMSKARIDPIADIETIETELMLADLDSLEKRVAALEKKAKGSDKEAKEALDLVSARSRCCARASRRALVERKPEEERACSRCSAS